MKNFNPNFTNWLSQNYNLEIKSIHLISVKCYHYQKWLDTHKLALRHTTYSHIMTYIGHLQAQGKSKHIINMFLYGIGYYYIYFKLPNLTHKVRVMGVKRELPLLLKSDELDIIYQHYQDRVAKGYFRYSNKILLGLFIYQALDLQDLLKLRLSDVDLIKGTLNLCGGIKRKNPRILKLEAHQIIALHQYITSYRNKDTTAAHNGTTDLVFSPQCETLNRLTCQCKSINRSLRKFVNLDGINYKDLPQLRKSRIALWIKQYGLRKAQYLSGLRCISSVERYQKMDLDDLSKQIEKFHPLQ